MVEPTTVAPQDGGGALPVGSGVGRLLAEAQRQAERLQAAVDAVAEALEVRGAGRARVADVLDLLADGQGELLVAQESAASGLRRQVTALTTAVDAAVEEVRSASASARREVGGVVEALTTAGDATAGSLSEAADRLAAAAHRLVVGVDEELQVAIARVDARVEEAAARLETLTTAGAQRLEAAATAAAARLEEAAANGAGRLTEIAQAAGDRVERSARTAAEQVEAASSTGAERMTAAAETSTARVEQTSALTADRLEQVAVAATSRVEDLAKAAAARLEQAAAAGAAALGDAVREGVDRMSATFADELLRTGRGVAAEVDGALGRLDAGVLAFDDALRGATDVAAERIVATADSARGHLDAAVLRSREELAADREEWRAAFLKLARRTDSLMGSAAERVESAAVGLVDGVEQAAAAARDDLVAAVDAAGAQAAAFRVELVELLQRWDDREVARDKRVEARVAKLEARADAATKAAADRLGKATAELVSRDERLEAARVEEFVRVLDEVLSRSGASGRDLRARIRKALAPRDMEEGR